MTEESACQVTLCDDEEQEEPDVCDDDPFDEGVENGDKEAPAVVPVSKAGGNFEVDSDVEIEEGDDLGYVSPFTYSAKEDPSVVEEPEQPGNLEDLDSTVIVTGDDWNWKPPRDEDETMEDTDEGQASVDPDDEVVCTGLLVDPDEILEICSDIEIDDLLETEFLLDDVESDEGESDCDSLDSVTTIVHKRQRCC